MCFPIEGGGGKISMENSITLGSLTRSSLNDYKNIYWKFKKNSLYPIFENIHVQMQNLCSRLFTLPGMVSTMPPTLSIMVCRQPQAMNLETRV